MIRKHFSPTVPIIVRMDSGFCDQKIFKELEALGVGYVCGGVTAQSPPSSMVANDLR
jgi:hypothetical protein